MSAMLTKRMDTVPASSSGEGISQIPARPAEQLEADRIDDCGLVALVRALANDCECEQGDPREECIGAVERWWIAIFCDAEQREELKRRRNAARIDAGAAFESCADVGAICTPKSPPTAKNTPSAQGCAA